MKVTKLKNEMENRGKSLLGSPFKVHGWKDRYLRSEVSQADAAVRPV